MVPKHPAGQPQRHADHGQAERLGRSHPGDRHHECSAVHHECGHGQPEDHRFSEVVVPDKVMGGSETEKGQGQHPCQMVSVPESASGQ